MGVGDRGLEMEKLRVTGCGFRVIIIKISNLLIIMEEWRIVTSCGLQVKKDQNLEEWNGGILEDWYEVRIASFKW